MKITSFNRASARMVQEKAVAALQEALAPLGLTVSASGGSLGQSKATLRFDFEVGDQGDKEARDRATFASLCGMYGLKPEHFGGAFVHGRAVFFVCGIQPTRAKYPVRAKRAGDGKEMLFTADTVLLGVKLPAPAGA